MEWGGASIIAVEGGGATFAAVAFEGGGASIIATALAAASIVEGGGAATNAVAGEGGGAAVINTAGERGSDTAFVLESERRTTAWRGGGVAET